MPMGAQSIGIWKVIFQGLCTIGIFSTFGLLVITDESFTDDSDTAFQQFIFFAAGGIVIKIVLSVLIPEYPDKLKVVNKRHQNVL